MSQEQFNKWLADHRDARRIEVKEQILRTAESLRISAFNSREPMPDSVVTTLLGWIGMDPRWQLASRT